MNDILFVCYILPMIISLIGVYFLLQKDFSFIERNRTFLKCVPFIPFMNQLFMFYFIGFFFLWVIDKLFIETSRN